MNKKILYGVVVLFLVGLSLLIRSSHPVKLPPAVPEACGIEQCHGLEITCGPDIPEMCTMEMRLEDFCREHIRCEKIGKECRLIKEPGLDQCRSCIEKCSKEEGEEVFQCAGKCVE